MARQSPTMNFRKDKTSSGTAVSKATGNASPFSDRDAKNVRFYRILGRQVLQSTSRLRPLANLASDMRYHKFPRGS